MVLVIGVYSKKFKPIITQEPSLVLQEGQTYSVECTLEIRLGEDVGDRYPLIWITEEKFPAGAFVENQIFKGPITKTYVSTLEFTASLPFSTNGISCTVVPHRNKFTHDVNEGNASIFYVVIAPPSKPIIEGPTNVTMYDYYRSWNCSSENASLVAPSMHIRDAQNNRITKGILTYIERTVDKFGYDRYDIRTSITVPVIYEGPEFEFTCHVYHVYDNYHYNVTTALIANVEEPVETNHSAKPAIHILPNDPVEQNYPFPIICTVTLPPESVTGFPLSWEASGGLPRTARTDLSTRKVPGGIQYRSILFIDVNPSTNKREFICIATSKYRRNTTNVTLFVIGPPPEPKIVGPRFVNVGETNSWLCVSKGASLVIPTLVFRDHKSGEIYVEDYTLLVQENIDLYDNHVFIVTSKMSMTFSETNENFLLRCTAIQHYSWRTFKNSTTFSIFINGTGMIQSKVNTTEAFPSVVISEASIEDSNSHGSRCRPELLTGLVMVLTLNFVKKKNFGL